MMMTREWTGLRESVSWIGGQSGRRQCWSTSTSQRDRSLAIGQLTHLRAELILASAQQATQAWRQSKFSSAAAIFPVIDGVTDYLVTGVLSAADTVFSFYLFLLSLFYSQLELNLAVE